jgi:uncharacterized membrane protein
VVQFTVKAAGTPPISYQWRKDQIVIASATGAAYAIAGAVKADTGSYTVNVTDVVRSVTIASALFFNSQKQETRNKRKRNVLIRRKNDGHN